MVRTLAWVVFCGQMMSVAASAGQQLAAPVPGVLTASRSVDAVAVPAGTAPMRVDGTFDEAVWQTAVPAGTFLQREPNEGAATTHATDVRVAYDSDALYVAVRAYDPEPDEVVGLLTRRDEDSPSDWISILIDSFSDRRTAYEFAVNVAGVKQDRYWFNDTNNDRGWDAVWDVATLRTSDGWQAEFRIGFSQLRFRGMDTGSLGFATMRTVAHLDETSTWPLLARSASGFVSSFGELRGLTLASQPNTFEVLPYALAQATTSPLAEGNPFVTSPDGSFSAGVDVKYQVAPGLTLTGTANPDFGQVEADPAVVNLGAFETFFAERRPFFLEGSGNFQFRNLFYSRRIGRAPQRTADAPEHGFVEQPTNTTILGAAKLTGRVGAFSVGALSAVTAAEYARVAPEQGSHTRTPVEPASAYTVARVSRDFADQSRITFMGTSTYRSLSDELTFLPSTAVTGGAEGDLRFGPSGHYSLQGFWAGSYVEGSASAIARVQRSTVHSFQRPDATHVTYDPTRTSIGGHSGGVSLNKLGGARVVFNSNAGFRSPGYDVNDLGFQSRADEIWMENWIQFKDETPGRYLRTFRFNVNQWGGWNFDGDQRRMGFNINAHWRFLNSWGFGSGASTNMEAFDDRLTRGGPGGLVPGTRSAWAYVESDDRKPVSFYFEQGVFADDEGSHDSSQWIRTTIRAGSALTFGLEMEISNRRTAQQWVNNLTTDTGAQQYIFGAIDQTTVGFGTRVNYTLTPRLSLQLYARPFVSAGAYESFQELVAPRAPEHADRYQPFDYTRNPDFNVHSFRTTNVLRWEYSPGSQLFVVWQQGRDGYQPNGDFELGREMGRIFDVPAHNVFLVKVTRWFDL